MSTDEASVSAMWPSRRIRVLIWFVYVLSWSTALLVPVPSLGDRDVQFMLAKTLHVAAYAVLALLTLWLRAAGWWHWLLLVFLFAHGVLTEFCQWYFPALRRTGQVADVIRDWVGVALGLALWLGWCEWLRRDNPREATVASSDSGTFKSDERA
jgi:VanZ family protein